MKFRSNNFNSKILIFALVLAHTFTITGCTTLKGPENPNDPYESFNRSVYSFNEKFDEYAYQPVAKAYKFITPDFVDTGITNFFSNIDDVLVVFNDVFQFKIVQAASDLSRFIINSTIGIFGFFDVATQIGLEKHNEDFGQTLGTWGVDSGPYLVIPFLGPSSVRDGIGLVADTSYLDPLNSQLEGNEQLAVYGIKYIDKRADLLKISNLLNEVAPDPYAFLRDSWTQQRTHLIYDGNPPVTKAEELFEDDLFKDDIIRK